MQKILLLFFLCIVANNQSFAAPVSESLEFFVEDSPILDIDASFGDITLTNSVSNKVVVEYDTQDTTNIKVEQRGNGIYIEAKAIYNRNSFSKWWKLWKSREEAQYRIQIPVNGRVKIRLGGGEVIARDFSGDLNYRARGGKISLYNSSVIADITTVGGGVFLKDSSGNFDIHTVGGPIDIEGMNNSELDVSTSRGSIDFSNSDFSGGSYEFSAANGSIQISHSENAAFDLSGWYLKEKPIIHKGLKIWVTEEPSEHSKQFRTRYPFKGIYNGGGTLVEVKVGLGLISLQLD